LGSLNLCLGLVPGRYQITAECTTHNWLHCSRDGLKFGFSISFGRNRSLSFGFGLGFGEKSVLVGL